MKKLSAVQLKQQAAVLAAVTTLETEAQAKMTGVVQCWFSLEYEAFPSSLLVRVQFVDDAALENSKSALLTWQQRNSQLLLKKGIVLKAMRNHLVFTCDAPDC